MYHALCSRTTRVAKDNNDGDMFTLETEAITKFVFDSVCKSHCYLIGQSGTVFRCQGSLARYLLRPNLSYTT